MTRAVIHYPLGRDRRLFWIDGFLRPAQCRQVLEELAFARWRPSGVLRHVGLHTPETSLSPTRVSESALESWFPLPLQQLIGVIDRRLERLVPRLRVRREEWQATRYAKGGKFDYHFDSGHWANEPAGDRKHTVLIYLDTPPLGGSTRFCELGLAVKAETGRLVVWRNLTRDNRRDLEMMHSSAPLLAGRKTVLVTWVRQRKLRKGRVT